MENKKLKITAFTACGTYPTHIDYTIASIYHLVDQVIVVNGGYDVKDITKGDDIPVDRDTKLLRELDVDDKIKIFKPTWKGLKQVEKGREEAGRGRNLSMAVQAAYKLGADWVLKTDADILFHQNVSRNDLLQLIKDSNEDKLGYRFGMWELQGDYAHYQGLPDWAPDDSQEYPSSNDAPQFYYVFHDDWYHMGGAPVTMASISPYQKINCYHVRYCPPPGCDPYDYFYKRFWYHLVIPEYTRGDKIDFQKKDLEVKKKTLAHLQMCKHIESLNPINNGDDPRIPKETPLVIKLGTKEYIQMKKEEL